MRKSILIFFCTALYGVQAAERSVDLSAAYSLSRAVETFADPLYVGETDYLSSPAQQMRLMAKMENIFPTYLQLAYQGLSVKSVTESRGTNSYSVAGYYASFFHASTALDSGVFRWHFGFSALLSFASRSFYDETTGRVLNDMAVNTRLSQAYPSGGFTLFPKAPIRLSLLFLNGDANLLYGWLRLQVEFETGMHTFRSSFELLNHQSFGKGLPNFVQPPGAFVLGYAIRFDETQLFTRVGFVLNSTQGFDSARVSFVDRLIFEFGAGYKFRISP